ncbi:MAG: hypothetical protein V4538_09260 [Bacteroidota bacterium]
MKNSVELIDIISFIKNSIMFLLTKLLIIILISLLGGLIGFYIAHISKPTYISKYSFILNENEGSSGFNLSSLAGIAGIAGIGGNTNVNEDKLLYIANSRQLIGNTLLEKVVINDKPELLVNHFIDIYKLSSIFQSDTSLNSFTYFKHNLLDSLSYQENKVLDLIIKRIVDDKLLTIDTKKKTGIVIQSAGIIAIDFKSINEKFAKLFVESLFKNLSEYYTTKSIHRQLKNYQLIKFRADSIRTLLYEKESYGAGIFDRNLKVIRMQGRVDVERTKRDVEMLSLMYAEVLKNLEIAKFALDNQTPFFQTVDKPTLPLEKKKLSRLISAIIGSVITSILLSIYLITKNLKTIINSN